MSSNKYTVTMTVTAANPNPLSPWQYPSVDPTVTFPECAQSINVGLRVVTVRATRHKDIKT
jgi:hypothetical protein